MTEAEVFASCLALSHCHFLDTPYEGDPFSDELNSGASNVCHYCTIDTLLSIIEKQCLRFTDVRFLNDSTEFLEIIPLIEHVLTNGNYSSSFKQFFLQPSIIEDLKSYRQSYSAISNVDQTYKDIGMYLAFLIDKMADYHSTICVWHTTRELVANSMRRQAIQMTWDYAEGNPLSEKSGSFSNMISWISNAHSLRSSSSSP